MDQPPGIATDKPRRRGGLQVLDASDRLSIRFRPVGIPSNEDLVEFADYVFFNKPLSAEFGQFAYPEEPNGFRWTSPK